jgi:tetratricopeptide (TPR) repeat protein
MAMGLLFTLAAAAPAASPAYHSAPPVGADSFPQNPGAQGKPSIAPDVETPEKKSVQKPVDQPKNPQRRRLTPTQPAPPPPLDVTFTTDIPQSEILLSLPGMRTQKLGTTDAEGKLTVKLPRGMHNVFASHVGHQIQKQMIEVRPNNTNFSFNITSGGGQVKSSEQAKPQAEPSPARTEEAAKTQPPATNNGAEDVLKRYLDPTQTDSLTASDWTSLQTQTSAALEKEPDNSELKARALLAQGQLAYLRSDYANALVAFNKASLAEPESVVIRYSLGNAYLVTNQPAEAFKAYQRAAELDRTLALAYKGMGDALNKQGRSKEALSYYEKARSLGQSSTSTAFNSVNVLLKRKRWAEALKELTEISKTEQTADTYINIGDCYNGLKQPISAAQAYHKAMDIDPKSALAAYRYGSTMFEVREYASAMEALERSLALDVTGAIINRSRARDMANKAAKKLRKMK